MKNTAVSSRILAMCLAMAVCPFLGLFPHAEGVTEKEYSPVEWNYPYAVGHSGGYPRMTAVGGGRLFLTFEGSKELKCTTSLGGRTWTSPTVAVSYKGTGYSPANPTPYYDTQTGVLYLAYRCPIQHEDSYQANIAYVTSTDNGVSWSEPYIVACSDVRTQSEYGGMWEPTVYRIDGKLRIYYSCDTVREGTGQVLINKNTPAERIDDTFPYVSSKRLQNIVMHELDEQTGVWSGGVGVYKGEDHLPYTPKGTNYHCRDGMQSIAQLSDGTYVMAVETSKYNVASSYGMTRYPMVIDISFTRDGVSFSAPVTIAKAPKAGYKCAAPWVDTLPDGRIAISCQTDDYLPALPSGTDTGNYGQLKVFVSKQAVTYENAQNLSAEDFEAFYPFERLNTAVTYNYWNSICVAGDKLYAIGNISTNDKNITPSRGTQIAVFDSAKRPAQPADTAVDTEVQKTEPAIADTSDEPQVQPKSQFPVTALIAAAVAAASAVVAAVIIRLRKKQEK